MTTPRYSVAISYNAANNLLLSGVIATNSVALSSDTTPGPIALTYAVTDSNQLDAILDVGVTSCPANERIEAINTLLANGISAKATQYSSDFVLHARADAVLGLHNLQPRNLTNSNTFYAPTRA